MNGAQKDSANSTTGIWTEWHLPPNRPYVPPPNCNYLFGDGSCGLGGFLRRSVVVDIRLRGVDLAVVALNLLISLIHKLWQKTGIWIEKFVEVVGDMMISVCVEMMMCRRRMSRA